MESDELVEIEFRTLRWVDIDRRSGHFIIQGRPEYRFKPKKHHCRSIPVDDDVLEQLRIRKLTSKFPLVFLT